MVCTGNSAITKNYLEKRQQRLKKKKRKKDRRLEMSDSTESKNSLSSSTLLWNIFHRLNCQYCTLICLISIFCVYFEYLNIVLQIFEFGTYGAPEVSDVSLSNWELPFLSNLNIKERKLGIKKSDCRFFLVNISNSSIRTWISPSSWPPSTFSAPLGVGANGS